MSKEGDFENITDMYVGSRIPFRIAIHFPTGTTDISVELFSADNDTVILALCNPTVSWVGDNLNTNSSVITPKLESIDSTRNMDRAVLDLGNITNSGSSVTNTDSMIFIDFVVVMVENNQTVNGSETWVSVGAEYLNQDYIWVGQASFVTLVDTYSNSSDFAVSSFNLTGPSEEEAAIGSLAVVKLDMFIATPSITLAVEAFGPLNDTFVDDVSICTILVTTTGSNYKCLDKDLPSQSLFKSTSGSVFYRGRLDIGSVTNAGSREVGNTDANNSISVEFSLRIRNNQALIGREIPISAAVEVGSTEIWAGQISMTISNYTDQNMTKKPTFSLSALNGTTEVNTHQTVMYQLDMKVPESTTAKYTLEVLAAYNTTAQMKICSVELVSTGINLPCICTHTNPVYSSRDASELYNDRVVWDLGIIRNTGHRSESENQTANTVTLRIIGQVLNHSLNVDGTTLWLTTGVGFSTDQLWLGQTDVTLSSSLNFTDPTNETSPEFDIKYSYGEKGIYIGGTGDVRVVLTTKPGMTFYPMTFELVTPYANNSAVMTICRATVTRLGKNIPCVSLKAANSSITYSSNVILESTEYIKAVGDIGYCTNPFAATNGGLDDEIELSLAFMVNDHVSIVDNTTSWVSSGIQFGNTQLLVGQISSYGLRQTQAVYDNPNSNLGYYDVVAKSGTLNVAPGGKAVFEIIIKVPPQSTIEYNITATVPSTVHVCNMRLKVSGYNIPCLDTTKLSDITQHTGLKTNEKAFIGRIVLSNIGSETVANTSTFDNNTVVIEVMTKLLESTSHSSSHALTFHVTDGSSQAIINNLQKSLTSVHALRPTASNITATPNITFEFPNGTTNGTSLFKGQAQRINIWLALPRDFEAPLILNITGGSTGQDGVLEFCNANMMFIGNNLPCLKKGFESISFTKSSTAISTVNNIVQIDFGTVCQHQLSNDQNSDKVMIELIASIPRKPVSNLNEDDIVSLAVNLQTGSDVLTSEILRFKYTQNFTDTFINSETVNDTLLSLKDGNLTKYISVRETVTLELTAQIPSNTSLSVEIDAESPGNDSQALFVVKNIRFTSSGTNLACVSSEVFDVTYKATLFGCQNDTAMVNLGVVTNTGLTSRLNTYNSTDDELVFEIDIEATDHVLLTNGSKHWISTGTKLGSVIYIVNKLLTVRRYGTERAYISMTSFANNSKVYEESDILTIDFTVKHDNNSKAEANNMTLTVYIPPYLTYEGVTWGSYAANGTKLNKHNVQFTYDKLLFDCITTFSVSFKLNATKLPPALQKNPSPVTITHLGFYSIYNRENHVNDASTRFKIPTGTASVTMNLIPSSNTQSMCNLPLGMQDMTIKDCQITGSPSHPAYMPQKGRIGSTGWMPGVRRGEYNNFRYIQVYFGNKVRVNKINIEEASFAVGELRSFNAYYSNDGNGWTRSEQVVLTPGYSTTTAVLAKPIEARYIRLVMKDQSGTQDDELGLKFEFYGCNITNDISATSMCKSSNQLPEKHDRGFLETNNACFVCDAVPSMQMKTKCFHATDASSWRALDQRVGNVIGYLPSENTAFAIAGNGVTYMKSKDDGKSWVSIQPSKWEDAKTQSGLILHKEIQWKKEATKFDPLEATPHADYKMNKWGAAYDGMYYDSGSGSGWIKSLDWARCCGKL